ncbi:MAG: tetratricopeptide repeat protein, partial [Roseimicrobium sp.]
MTVAQSLRRALPLAAATLSFCFVTCVSGAQGQQPLGERADYQAALRASKQEMHVVAAVKFERLLQDAALSRVEASALSERLVDALVRAKLPEKATVALTLFDVPDAPFWRGQVALLQRRFREAEVEFRQFTEAGGKHAGYARLALGQALIAQGHENTGRKEFKALTLHPDASLAQQARLLSHESEARSADRAAAVLRRLGTTRGSPESEFVKACALIELGDGKQAEIVLRRFLEGQQKLPKRLNDAALVRLAEAYLLQSVRTRAAERALLEVLESEMGSDYLEQAFDLLPRAMASDAEGLGRRLAKWSDEERPAERQALALFHFGRWLGEQGRVQEAALAMESFRTKHPKHDRQSEALRLLMAFYGTLRDDDRVLELAKTWRARFGSGGVETLDFLTGIIRHGRSEYTEAAVLFEKAAIAATDGVQAQRAFYNAGVSAFLGGDEKRLRLCLAELQVPASADEPAAAPDPAARLLLERALTLASKQDVTAEDALQDFLKQYPTHPRAVEAYLAQAELCLLDLPSRTKAAGAALDAAAAIPGLSDAWKERLDLTRLWWHEGAKN